MVVQCAEHLLACELPVTERASGFWLSNLPAETAPERLASLVRLANRSHVERVDPDRLIAALAGDGAGADRDPQTAAAKRAVDA